MIDSVKGGIKAEKKEKKKKKREKRTTVRTAKSVPTGTLCGIALVSWAPRELIIERDRPEKGSEYGSLTIFLDFLICRWL